MNNTKPFWKSKGFWGPTVALLALAADHFDIGPIDQAATLDAIFKVLEYGGAIFGLYGRAKAKGKLSLGRAS